MAKKLKKVGPPDKATKKKVDKLWDKKRSEIEGWKSVNFGFTAYKDNLIKDMKQWHICEFGTIQNPHYRMMREVGSGTDTRKLKWYEISLVWKFRVSKYLRGAWYRFYHNQIIDFRNWTYRQFRKVFPYKWQCENCFKRFICGQKTKYCYNGKFVCEECLNLSKCEQHNHE